MADMRPPMAWSTTPSGGLGLISKLRQCAHNRLVAQIIRKRLGSQHTAAAAAQIATSIWDPVREKIVRIDPTVPGDKPLGDAICSFKVAAPNTVRQPVSGTVYQIDRLVFVVERDDIGHWSENFFPRANIAGLARHQRRFDVIAVLVPLNLRAPA